MLLRERILPLQSRYFKHVDNPNFDGRKISCVYYLNKDWDAERDGGALRIYPEEHPDQVRNGSTFNQTFVGTTSWSGYINLDFHSTDGYGVPDSGPACSVLGGQAQPPRSDAGSPIPPLHCALVLRRQRVSNADVHQLRGSAAHATDETSLGLASFS